jgi:hypothetical protein
MLQLIQAILYSYTTNLQNILTIPSSKAPLYSEFPWRGGWKSNKAPDTSRLVSTRFGSSGTNYPDRRFPWFCSLSSGEYRNSLLK